MFSYSNVVLDSTTKLIDGSFPIPRNKIVSIEGVIFSPTWSSIPAYLYVTNNGLYIGQNITASNPTVTINVIVRYVK